MLLVTRIVQAGTPKQLLAEPVNASGSDFIGRADLGLKLLGLQTVAATLRPWESGFDPPAERIAADATLREAMSTFVVRGVARLGARAGATALPSSRHPDTAPAP